MKRLISFMILRIAVVCKVPTGLWMSEKGSFLMRMIIDWFRKTTAIKHLCTINFFFKKRTFIIFSKKKFLFWKKSKNLVFNIFFSLKILRSDEKKRIRIAIRLNFSEDDDKINWKKYWKRSISDSRKKKCSKSFDF